MLFRSDRKSTRLNSSHTLISYAVFCLKKKKKKTIHRWALAAPALGILLNLSLCSRTALLLSFPRPTRPSPVCHISCCFFFFFNDPATTEIYPLPLHDALPI